MLQSSFSLFFGLEICADMTIPNSHYTIIPSVCNSLWNPEERKVDGSGRIWEFGFSWSYHEDSTKIVS